jgi:hypothetical protein
MKNLINFDDVNNKIITIRNQNVILDSNVAKLYGVEPKEINQAVKRNPDKFPEGYIFQVKANEFDHLLLTEQSDNQGAVTNCDRTLTINHLEKTRVLPKAFTERGLYMLATILKSPRATQTTITIVDAFAKLRELSYNIAMLNSMNPEVIEPEIVESTGGLMNELLFSGFPTSAETSLEFNLGLIKAKRMIKSENTTLQNKIDRIEKMIEEMKEHWK